MTKEWPMPNGQIRPDAGWLALWIWSFGIPWALVIASLVIARQPAILKGDFSNRRQTNWPGHASGHLEVARVVSS